MRIYALGSPVSYSILIPISFVKSAPVNIRLRPYRMYGDTVLAYKDPYWISRMVDGCTLKGQGQFHHLTSDYGENFKQYKVADKIEQACRQEAIIHNALKPELIKVSHQVLGAMTKTFSNHHTK